MTAPLPAESEIAQLRESLRAERAERLKRPSDLETIKQLLGLHLRLQLRLNSKWTDLQLEHDIEAVREGRLDQVGRPVGSGHRGVFGIINDVIADAERLSDASSEGLQAEFEGFDGHERRARGDGAGVGAGDVAGGRGFQGRDVGVGDGGGFQRSRVDHRMVAGGVADESFELADGADDGVRVELSVFEHFARKFAGYLQVFRDFVACHDSSPSLGADTSSVGEGGPGVVEDAPTPGRGGDTA